MKTYNAAVVVESEVTIRINPNVNTNTLIEEFSECMYGADTIGDLIQYACMCIARHEPTFLEGIGRIEYDYGQGWGDDVVMLYTISTDVSTEIVD